MINSKIEVIIPKSFISLFDKISELNGKNEFGAFYNYSVIEDLLNKKIIINLEKEFYVPKQKVTETYFEVDENLFELIQSNYKGAIHRHPRGVKNFSITDYKNLNPFFEISIIRIPESNYFSGEVYFKVNSLNLKILKPIDEFIIVDDTEYFFNSKNISSDELSIEIKDTIKKLKVDLLNNYEVKGFKTFNF
jgi:hypothetical protein